MTEEMKFERGQIVYDRRGKAWVFESELPDDDDGFIVSMHGWPEERVCISEAFAEAPTSEREREIARLDAQIAKRREELVELRHEVAMMGPRLKALRERSHVLARIEDVLDGKITHVAWISLYGQVAVGTPAEVLQDTSGWNRSLKLVTLFGATGGDLSWRVNQYRDGSGSWQGEVVLCTSLLEAFAAADAEVLKRLDGWEETTLLTLGHLIRWADERKLEVPIEARRKVADAEVEHAKRERDGLAQRLAKAEERLAKAESEVPRG